MVMLKTETTSTGNSGTKTKTSVAGRVEGGAGAAGAKVVSSEPPSFTGANSGRSTSRLSYSEVRDVRLGWTALSASLVTWTKICPKCAKCAPSPQK